MFFDEPPPSPEVLFYNESGKISKVLEIGAGDTCPDYVIAVFPHLGETVVYADEWEVINA